MTDDELRAIAERAEAVRTARSVVAVTNAITKLQAFASADIPALLAEVRFLRGLLADACHDGRAVARVMRLRKELRAILELPKRGEFGLKALDIARAALAADAEGQS